MGGTGVPWLGWAPAPLCTALVTVLTGCAIMPGELNLSPIYRHRLDPDGSVREMDVLWPVFHYRKTEDDGWEFRIRPLYRYVAEGPKTDATEHQFLWPFGRVRHANGETRSRLFPLWRYQSRLDDEGLRETDWNVALLIWGGSKEDGTEDYFAFMPFYADIPDFLTYDRFQMHLFPLHVGLSKGDSSSHQFLWPLIGWGGNEAGDEYWHRVLPLYGVNVHEGEYERYTALWPFVHWGYENIDTGDPVFRFFLFPLVGWQTSEKVHGWTALWPLFQEIEVQDELYKLDVLWPIFRYRRNDSESSPMLQWWVWPLVGHSKTPYKDAWSFLWPLIWVGRYDDPEGVTWHRSFLPFYSRTTHELSEGGVDDFLRIWPLYHRTTDHTGESDWQALSIWPWRGRYADGIQQLYGWLWTLAAGRTTPESSSWELAGNLFTTAERAGRRQTSVPFLFNYESDETQSTLRLLQFIPIRWSNGGGRGSN